MITQARDDRFVMLRKPNKQGRSKFAIWIIERREELGWTQDDVVAHADSDLTQGYISSLERDVRKPSRDMVKLLARTLYSGEVDLPYARFEARAMEAAGFQPDASDEAPDDEERRRMEMVYQAYKGTTGPIREIVNTALGLQNDLTGEEMTMEDIARITGQHGGDTGTIGKRAK